MSARPEVARQSGRQGRDPAPAPPYECGWCGRSFREDRGQPACRACPLTRLCGRVRCPHCGWESPALPGWHDRTADPADAGATERWWERLARRLLPAGWLTSDEGDAP